MIKAEEMGTNRLAGQGTVGLEMWVVKSRLRSFMMLCSFLLGGSFFEVTGLIRPADVRVNTAGSLFCVIRCSVARENVKKTLDQNHKVFKNRHDHC